MSNFTVRRVKCSNKNKSMTIVATSTVESRFASAKQTHAVIEGLVLLYGNDVNKWPNGTGKLAKIMNRWINTGVKTGKGQITKIQYREATLHLGVA